jgi:hypothetical protein
VSSAIILAPKIAKLTRDPSSIRGPTFDTEQIIPGTDKKIDNYPSLTDTHDTEWQGERLQVVE